MSEMRITTGDRLKAEALEFGSVLNHRFPFFRTLVEAKAPHVSVQWFHARMPVSALLNTQTYKPARGLTPKHYPKAAILALPKAEVDEHQLRQGGVHAVAYALGSTVIVGAQLKQEIFQATDDERHYRVAMGIGGGPLIASAGVWHSEHRTLWVPEAFIENDGVVPVEKIPPEVPYV